jgi:D-alanyl-D-alanine carboxypeptidase
MEHSQKFIFLGVVIALALFSRALYPMLYPVANGSLGAATSTVSLAADAPIFVAASGAVSPSSTPALEQEPSIAGAGAVDPLTPTGGSSSPTIADQASLIADLQTGYIFFGDNANKRWPMASVTKLMTASIVFDNLNMNQKITITAEDVEVDPGQTLLNVGDTYTVSDLLYMLLLPSSNVAAEALAEYYGRANFLAAMNERAANWGMADTHYDDPSGLSAGNESTPDDLLKLAQQIYAHYPQILAITRTPHVVVTDLVTGKQVSVTSINDFAGRADFIGGKTGYTNEADGNLLSIFNYENRPVLVLVMGTDDSDRFNNTLVLYNWFTANFK